MENSTRNIILAIIFTMAINVAGYFAYRKFEKPNIPQQGSQSVSSTTAPEAPATTTDDSQTPSSTSSSLHTICAEVLRRFDGLFFITENQVRLICETSGKKYIEPQKNENGQITSLGTCSK